jgi:hypothetical protein
MPQQRRHDRVVTGQRAGMGEGRGARSLATPGVHQNDRLAQRSRTFGKCEEQLRAADLFDEQRNGLGLVIAQQEGEKVFATKIGFVAARNHMRDAQSLA